MKSDPLVKLTVFACVALAVGLLSRQCEARIRICNDTGANVSLALVSAPPHFQGPVVIRGWWNLAPKQCQEVSSADATQRWTYLRATGRNYRSPGSSPRFCASNAAFTWQMDPNKPVVCPPNYQLMEFRKLEPTRADWTETLEQPNTY